MPTLNPYDKVMSKKGLEYEKLTPEERKFYQKANKDIQSVTFEEVKDNLEEIVVNLQLQLCDTPDTSEHQDENKYLKARIKNYLLLIAFIVAPEKLAKSIEQSIEELEIDE